MTSLCPHFTVCSGCSTWEGEQDLLPQKVKILSELLDCAAEGIQTRSAGKRQIRNWLDFTIVGPKKGLYHKQDKRQISDLEVCEMLLPGLQSFYQDFRKIDFAVEKGSFRLRLSFDGKLRGAWLDFANLDVKRLLEEGDALKDLMKLGFVEIGQRRKALVQNEKGQLKLAEPQLHTWTRTWQQGREVPLLGVVGGFSQVGDKTNTLIVETLEEFFQKLKIQRALEYGSGQGNLTFPLLSAKGLEHLDILENSELARLALQQNLENQKVQNVDFLESFEDRGYDLILANPPRAGLKDFLGPLTSKSAPQNFIYMSCFPESLAVDAKILRQLGYQMTNTVIIDQFPNTRHFEALTLWKLEA